MESESATGVTPFEGTLEAQLNPDYQETSYSFQYATEATGETLEGTIVTLKGTTTVTGGPAQAANAATGNDPDTGLHVLLPCDRDKHNGHHQRPGRKTRSPRADEARG